MNSKFKSFIFSVLVLLIFSCKSPVTNKDVIDNGSEVWLSHKTQLDSISQICYELFISDCNVYYILTSPRTDTYSQGVWIDDLYYEGCILKPTEIQVNAVNNLIPRPKIDDVYFLRNVFTSFGLSFMSNGGEPLFLIKIEDKDKFDKIYCLAELKNNELTRITDNWLYSLDDGWYVCSANLIHDGSKEVCSLLSSDTQNQ